MAHQLIAKKQHTANHTAMSMVILTKIRTDGNHKSLEDTSRYIMVSLAFPLHFYTQGLWKAYVFKDIFN